MEETFNCEPSSEMQAYMQANQLLRIARLEMNEPMENSRIMLFGSGEILAALAQMLENHGAQTDEFCEWEKVQNSENTYAAAFLFDSIKDEILKEKMLQNSLVLDIGPQKSGEWIVHDASPRYRRVRVISLSKG